MLAATVTFDLVFVLLIAAIALFVLSVFARVSRGWMLAIGLACFAAAVLVQWKF